MKKEIPVSKNETLEQIMNKVDSGWQDVRKEILDYLRDGKQYIGIDFDKIFIEFTRGKEPSVEVIKGIEIRVDKRWPVTIWKVDNREGYRIDKNWIEELHGNWHPIIDHPRRLSSIFVDAGLEDRVLIAQPYAYSDGDKKRLTEFCEKNHLKFIERDTSPYYVGGTGLIIIFEEDVKEHLLECLNIDRMNINEKEDPDRAYMNKKDR